MDTPAELSRRADHGFDWDATDARPRPVTPISRLASEGWVPALLGAVLVGVIGLLGWVGYSLSTVKGELRQLQAHVAQLEPRGAGDEAVPEETARRLHEMEQRLHAVESWTQDTAPRLTALERRPREKADRPQVPSPPQALPPATPLPWNAGGGVQTPRDDQAHRDMRQQAAASERFGAPVPESFGKWLEWDPQWELRWMSFQFRGHTPVYLYHITYKPDPRQRYTVYWDPDGSLWKRWQPWQRVP